MSRYIQSSRKIPPFYLVEKQDIFGSGAFQVFYQSCNWVPPAPKLRVRVVGAGGGSCCGGGGGGGGFAIGCFDVDTSTTYAITVGAGVSGAQGGTSSFSSLISATGGSYTTSTCYACCCNKGGCGIGGFCNTCGGQGGMGTGGGGGAAGSWIGNGGNGWGTSQFCGHFQSIGGSVGCATGNSQVQSCNTLASISIPQTINYLNSNPRFPFDSFSTLLPSSSSWCFYADRKSFQPSMVQPGIGANGGQVYMQCCAGTFMEPTRAGPGGGGAGAGCAIGLCAGVGGAAPGIGGGSGSMCGQYYSGDVCANMVPGGNGLVVVEW